MAARRPTGCGLCCAVASPTITRGSWPPGHGWRSISRPRSIPVRSRAAREVDRDATYFYYAWSVAHAFRSLGIAEIHSHGQRIAWADALARELIRRQRDDGAWTNRFTASKEDDPLVATSFAAGALGICPAIPHPLIDAPSRQSCCGTPVEQASCPK